MKDLIKVLFQALFDYSGIYTRFETLVCERRGVIRSRHNFLLFIFFIYKFFKI